MFQLPDGASKQRTDVVLSKVERYFLSNSAIHSTDAMSGLNFIFNTRGPNTATMFVPLHLWNERKEAHQHVKALIGAAYGEFAKIPEALILAFNAPSIRGLGATGGFSLQLQDPSGGDFKKFAAVVQEFLAKARKALANGLIPIICVGETLQQRESGVTEGVITTQIKGVLAGLPATDVERVVVAYEPVWAIGTGRNATPEQAQAVHAQIRGLIAGLHSRSTAEKVIIQYGGSVTPENVSSLMAMPDIDGALVGGASLKPESFAALVNFK